MDRAERRRRRAAEQQCPVCQKQFTRLRIQEHVEKCLARQAREEKMRQPRPTQTVKRTSSKGKANANSSTPGASASAAQTSSRKSRAHKSGVGKSEVSSTDSAAATTRVKRKHGKSSAKKSKASSAKSKKRATSNTTSQSTASSPPLPHQIPAAESGSQHGLAACEYVIEGHNVFKAASFDHRAVDLAAELALECPLQSYSRSGGKKVSATSGVSVPKDATLSTQELDRSKPASPVPAPLSSPSSALPTPSIVEDVTARKKKTKRAPKPKSKKTSAVDFASGSSTSANSQTVSSAIRSRNTVRTATSPTSQVAARRVPSAQRAQPNGYPLAPGVSRKAGKDSPTNTTLSEAAGAAHPASPDVGGAAKDGNRTSPVNSTSIGAIREALHPVTTAAQAMNIVPGVASQLATFHPQAQVTKPPPHAVSPVVSDAFTKNGASLPPAQAFSVQRRPTKAMAKAFIRRFLTAFEGHPAILDEFFQILRQSRESGAHAEDVALRAGQLFHQVKEKVPSKLYVARQFSQFLPADVSLDEFIVPQCSAAVATDFFSAAQKSMPERRFHALLQMISEFNFEENPPPLAVAQVFRELVLQLQGHEELLQKLVNFIPDIYVQSGPFKQVTSSAVLERADI